jgi:hypothetical protein
MNCMTMLKEKYFDGVEGIQELKKISNFKDEKRLIQGTQKDLTHL